MKIPKYVETLSMMSKWTGVIAIGANHQDSQWVILCSAVALSGLVIEALSSAWATAKTRDIDHIKCLEQRYLNAIKIKVEQRQEIEPGLLRITNEIIQKADRAHEDIFGHSRPQMWINPRENDDAVRELELRSRTVLSQ